MPANLKYTNLDRREISIGAYQTAAIDFIDGKPNYFRVQNPNNTFIYCGTTRHPSESMYDFSVAPNKAKAYAEPFQRSRLYVFNPSGNTINVIVVSMAAEYDPLSMMIGDMEVDFSASSVAVTSSIDSFNTSLPAGSNMIGKVQVSSLPSIPAGSNKIGNVGISGTVVPSNADEVTNIKNNVGDIQSKLGSLLAETPISGKTTLVDIVYALLQISDAMTKIHNEEFANKVSTYEETNTSGEKILCESGTTVIHLLTNDGENDFNLCLFGSGDTAYRNIKIKAGESISDFKFVGKVKLTGSGTSSYSYRAMISNTPLN